MTPGLTKESPLLRPPVRNFRTYSSAGDAPCPVIDLSILNSNSIMRRSHIIQCKRAVVLSIRWESIAGRSGVPGLDGFWTASERVGEPATSDHETNIPV